MNPNKLFIAFLILSAATGANAGGKTQEERVLRSKTYSTAGKAGKSAGYAKSSKSGGTSTIQTKPEGSGGKIIVTLSSSIDVSKVSITSGKRTRRQRITQVDFKTLMDETIREVVTGSLTATQNLTSVITTGTKQYIVNGTVVGTTAISQLVFEEKCTYSCTEQVATTTLSRTVISHMEKEVKNGGITTILRENAADDDIQDASVVGGTFNETGTSVATSSPTKVPTSVHTALPSQQPTTKSPTSSMPITNTPIRSPSFSPTAAPTRPPSEKPTTLSPTSSKPSASPTKSPTSIPTSIPSTQSPTTTPTNSPSLSPTSSKPTTVSPPPLSGTPTSSPVTKSPTATPPPPTAIPTGTPSAPLSPTSSKPSTTTAKPTTNRPTREPTFESDSPTYFPTSTSIPPTTEVPATETPAVSPIITITVSGGNFSSPYFNFEVDGGNMDVESFEFIPGSQYRFVGGASFDDIHPFFISDQGRLTASRSFDITSRKEYNTGIEVGESLEFKLPLDFSGTLTYYCVPHTQMTNTFIVASPASTMKTPFETRTSVTLERKRNRVGFF